MLKIDETKMKGTLAVEAVKSGNFEMAVMLCRELFSKSPNSATGSILLQVSQEMTRYCYEHPDVLVTGTEGQKQLKLTEYIQHFAQQALSLVESHKIQGELHSL